MWFCIVVREKKERVRGHYAGSEKKGKKGDYGTDILSDVYSKQYFYELFFIVNGVFMNKIF